MHYPEDVLLRFTLDRNSMPDAEGIEAHLENCGECASFVADVRAFDEGLSGVETWKIADERADRSLILRSLAVFAKQIEEENLAASRVLGSMLEGRPDRDAIARLPRQKRFLTGGVVRALCANANHHCDREPLLALALADAAIAIAEQLPRNLYPAGGIHQLIGLSYRERANALHFSGDYAAALEALDNADREYAQAPIDAFDQAIANYIRASILTRLDRLAEAEALAGETARRFDEFGDRQRFVHCRFLNGYIAYKRKDYASARSIWSELLPEATSLDDPSLVASLTQDVGICDLELGELARAGEAFESALAMWTKLGVKTEAVRLRWRQGRLFLLGGKFDEAIARLQQSVEECEAQGMLYDALLVTLDLAEALFAAGRSSDITRLCAGLVERFRERGEITNALAAFAYLNEASARGRVSPTKIEHVRDYVSRLEHNPRLLFAPPPELL